MQPDIGSVWTASWNPRSLQCSSSQTRHLVRELFAHDNLCLSLLCNCSVSTNYSLVWVNFSGCHLRPCCSWQECFTLYFSLSILFCLQKLSGWKITCQDKQIHFQTDQFSGVGHHMVKHFCCQYGGCGLAWLELDNFCSSQNFVSSRHWNYNFEN